MATNAGRIRGQRVAVGILLALLVGYVVVSIALEFVQSARHGYGSDRRLGSDGLTGHEDDLALAATPFAQPVRLGCL
jgi:hypothetical protein